MRQPVARRELAQAPRVGRVARADDPEPGAEADQDRAADDERAQDQIAEHGILGDELAQPVRGHDEDLAGLAHDRGHERRLARQQVELAEEAPCAVCGDQALGAVVSARRSRPGPAVPRRSRSSCHLRGRSPRPRSCRRRSPCASSASICSGLEARVRAVGVRRLGELLARGDRHGTGWRICAMATPARLPRRLALLGAGVLPAHDQLVVLGVERDRRAVVDVAGDQRAADPRLDLALDEAPQRARAVDRVVALAGDQLRAPAR